jgi:hypothetical protein
VQPGSPTTHVQVTVAGSTEPGARVRLFTGASCAGQPLGEGQADSAGGFRVRVDLTPNTTSSLYGQAVDAAGNVSLCSASPLLVTHDGVAPPAPALVETLPASPSSFNTHPVLSGTAEPGARVRVFSDAACERALPFDTAADTAGTFRVAVEVKPNTPTTFWARATDTAGNTSGCSGSGLAYTHDDLAPAAPADFTTTPASPSMALEPLWQAFTEPGARVRVFAEADCQGEPLAELRAGADGRFGVRLAARANAPLTRWLTLTDAAGNTSACRALGTYVHDDVPPAAPSLSRTEPASPSQSMTPSVVGFAAPFATVLLVQADSACNGQELGRGQATASGAFSIPIQLHFEGWYAIHARAMDAAGNLSACSTSYLGYHSDRWPPSAPSQYAFIPTSPSASSTSPTLVVASYSADEDVRLYTDATCTGTVVANPKTRVSYGYVYIPLSVAPGSTTSFYMTATDKAGNTSACSPVGRYVHVQEGQGWRTSRELPVGSAAVAGMDGQGHAFVLAQQVDDTGIRSVVWRSDDAGEWGAAHVLTSSKTWPKAKPVLGVNARGEAVAFWIEPDGRMRAVRYSPGSGWGSPEDLSAASTVNRFNVAAGMDVQGNALVTWIEEVPALPSSQYVLVSRAAPAGGVWKEEQRPQVTPYGAHLLQATPAGAVVMWSDSLPDWSAESLKARTFTHEAGWSAEAVIAPDSNYGYYHVAADAGGTLWSAYVRYHSGTGSSARYDIWVRRLPPGATGWTEAEKLPTRDRVHGDTRIEVLGGRAGEAMVALFDPYGAVLTHHHPPGGSWGGDAFVAYTSTSEPKKPRFAMGRDGEVYAAWVDASGPYIGDTSTQEQGLRLRRFDPASGWEPAVQLLAPYDERMQLFGLAGTSRGELVVLWNQYDGYSWSTLSTRWLR